LSIENVRDLEDYLKTLLNFSDARHRQFYEELLQKRQEGRWLLEVTFTLLQSYMPVYNCSVHDNLQTFVVIAPPFSSAACPQQHVLKKVVFKV
jgi:hypothetical protein